MTRTEMEEINEKQPGLLGLPHHTDSSDLETAPAEGDDSRSSQSQPDDDEKKTSSSDEAGFAPIKTPAQQLQQQQRRRGSVDSISTLRSNNGWGCDDVEANNQPAQSPANQPAAAAADENIADPFEVGWDGGDSDPLCPRSFPLWRKWLIIAITSIGSFCV